MQYINGYTLAISIFSLVGILYTMFYAMPPRSSRGKYVAEVHAVSPLGGTQTVRWRGTYHTRWLALVAAQHKARRFDHWGGIHPEFGVSWSVYSL